MSMSDMRVMGRATQGVRLIKLHEDDSIASVAKVDTTTLLKEDENAEDQAAEGAENTPQSNTEENTEKGDEKNDDESEG